VQLYTVSRLMNPDAMCVDCRMLSVRRMSPLPRVTSASIPPSPILTLPPQTQTISLHQPHLASQSKYLTHQSVAPIANTLSTSQLEWKVESML
jgi:hypothetical protein